MSNAAPSDLPPPSDEPTEVLVERSRAGSEEALERLVGRYLPRLRRWARGRLPRGARDLVDTDDLAQETLVGVVRRLPGFEARGPGAFAAYVRRALLNRLRDAARRAGRRPDHTGSNAAAQVADAGPSPVEEVLGHEALDRYERALGRLSQSDQEVLVTRLELDCTYDELARALGRPSADAARMAVSRALLRLAREMDRGA
jgi:RNA polymerase sigma factor (sigma-70 family)